MQNAAFDIPNISLVQVLIPGVAAAIKIPVIAAGDYYNAVLAWSVSMFVLVHY